MALFCRLAESTDYDSWDAHCRNIPGVQKLLTNLVKLLGLF